jgi:hypothetical protein
MSRNHGFHATLSILNGFRSLAISITFEEPVVVASKVRGNPIAPSPKVEK